MSRVSGSRWPARGVGAQRRREARRILDERHEPGAREPAAERHLVVVDGLAVAPQSRHDDGHLPVRQRDEHRADAGVRDDRRGPRGRARRDPRRGAARRRGRAGRPHGGGARLDEELLVEGEPVEGVQEAVEGAPRSRRVSRNRSCGGALRRRCRRNELRVAPPPAPWATARRPGWWQGRDQPAVKREGLLNPGSGSRRRRRGRRRGARSRRNRDGDAGAGREGRRAARTPGGRRASASRGCGGRFLRRGSSAGT